MFRPAHFSSDEQRRIRMAQLSQGFVLLNTSAGWWRFSVTRTDEFRFDFLSSGTPGEHAVDV
ncbi:hypothetical protein [Deinococcus hohokamensis]|uniref:Uncharacterized protein n=1 Tax=Deinococcus hohokamensis TaxID=309883 RepID=A0ABV9IDS1_9DEIO